MRRMLLIAAGALVASVLGQVGVGRAAPIIIFGTHYEENKGIVCPNNGNGCKLEFTAVPGGKILQIGHLSCTIFEENRRIVSVVLAQRQGAGPALIRKQYFVPVFVGGGAVPGIQRWAVNGAADLVLGPGAVPVVELVTDLVTDSSFSCQIVGKFVTAATVE